MRRLIVILFYGIIAITPLLIVPFTTDYYNTPKELAAFVGVVAVVALWLGEGARRGELRFSSNPVMLPLFAYYLWCGLSLLWAKSVYLGLKDSLYLLVYAGAFLVCMNTVERRSARGIALTAFLAGLVAAVYAFFQYNGLDFIHYPDSPFFADWRFRLYSTFGNPDFLAGYLILTFPVGLTLYLANGKRLPALFFLLALAVDYTVLLLAFSVGALLGLCAAVTVLIWLLRSGNIAAGRKKVAALLAAAVLISAFYLVDNKFNSPSLISKAKASFVWRHGWVNRVIIYKSSWRMASDNPLIGVGTGNFKLRFPEYRGRLFLSEKMYFPSSLIDSQTDQNVLNEFLEVWTETGVIGLLLFATALWLILRAGVRAYYMVTEEKDRLCVAGLLAGLAAFTVHSLLSFPFHIMPNGIVFWTFAGLLVAYDNAGGWSPISLRVDPRAARYVTAGIAAAALLACVWPAKVYLAEVFVKRTVGAEKRGFLSQAFIEAKSAQFFDPDCIAIMRLGRLARLANDYPAAVTYLKKALENTDAIYLHIDLARTYKQMGLTDDCIEEYRKALALNPLSRDIKKALDEVSAARK